MLLDVLSAKLRTSIHEIFHMDINDILKFKLTSICSTLSMNLIVFFDT